MMTERQILLFILKIVSNTYTLYKLGKNSALLDLVILSPKKEHTLGDNFSRSWGFDDMDPINGC